MQGAVGFTTINQDDGKYLQEAMLAQSRALSHFLDVDQLSIQIGGTRLMLWGRGNLQDTYYRMEDGSILLLVGSPLGDLNWDSIAKTLMECSCYDDYLPPWDDRYILLMISPDGRQWMLWNDWIGAIPVFHFETPEITIASTLEPVVVAGAGLGPEDIDLTSVLCLLIHGYYTSDWSMYKQMKVVRPDTISSWQDGDFSYSLLGTVSPTDVNWDKGWDELREQMYELSKKSITDALKSHSSWVIPLSGGFDSRLIAAVASELDIDLFSFTWGSRSSLDAIYARALAKELGIPWEFVDIGSNYLKDYTQVWADLFGSAMYFHGMYQMPFLDSIVSQRSLGPIVTGFLGEALAGYDVKIHADLHSNNGKIYQYHPDQYLLWKVDEVRSLLKVPADEAFDELGTEINSQNNIPDGPWFQRLRFLVFWGRQHYFTYFQSLISDYWRGVSAPFLNREYANFCMSLPRAALDERRLQRDMFVHYLPTAARVPTSYYREPMIFSGKFFLKRRISRNLPEGLLRGPFQEYKPGDKSLDGLCVKNGGIEVLWPIPEARKILDNWFNSEILENIINKAAHGDIKAVRKLQPIQALAYRLVDIVN